MLSPYFIDNHIRRPWFWGLFIFICLAISTLCRYPLYIDVRFALMVKDIAVHGFSPIPMVNGVPYGDYFAPWVWLSYVTTAFGQLADVQFFLVLPSILCLAITACMTFKFAELYAKGTGALAVLLLFLNYEVLDNCTTFGLDVPVMTATVTVLYGIAAEKRWRFVLFLVLAICCFAVRGPLGMVVFGVVTGGYLLGRGKPAELLLYGISGMMLFVLMFVGTWYFFQWSCGDRSLWDQMMLCQMGVRMGSREDPWFYFTDGLANLAPASVLMLWGFWQCRKQLKDERMRPILAAIVLTLVVMSIPGSKKLRYIMAMFPLVAVLAGQVLFNTGMTRVEKAFAWLIRYLDVHISRSLTLLLVVVTVHLARMKCFSVLWPALMTTGVIFYLLTHYQPDDLKEKFLRLAMISILLILGIGVPYHALRDDSSVFVQYVDILGTQTVYLCGVQADHDGLKYVFHTKKQDKFRFVEQEHPADAPANEAKGWRKFLPAENTPIAYNLHLFAYVTPETFKKECRPGDLVLVKEGEEEMMHDLLKGTGLEAGGCIKGNLGHKLHAAYQLKKLTTNNKDNAPAN